MGEVHTHTPGPWAVGKGIAFACSVYSGAALVAFARQDHSRIDAPTAEANARLIAAAPELLVELNVRASDLVMLRKAIEAGDPKAELLIRIEDMLRETRAAIAKATGKAEPR